MLTQTEFEHLIKLQKEFKENDQLNLSKAWSKEIVSLESRDSFILDYRPTRGIRFGGFSYNKRYRQTIKLVRFCSSVRHTNPDAFGGEVFDGPHIHIYQEGYDDKVAFSVTKIGLESNINKEHVLRKFLEYCNIVNIPTIQNDLF